MKRLLFGAAYVLSAATLGVLLGMAIFGAPRRAAPLVLANGRSIDATAVSVGDATVRVTTREGASVIVPERRLAPRSAPAATARSAPATRHAAVRREDDRATMALRPVAASVSRAYREGRRDVAERIVAEHPQVVTWNDGASNVACRAIYRDRHVGGEMELRVWRNDTEQPIAVAFPPGTYGTAPEVQELAFMRAPVVVLATGEAAASVTIPIACASFDLGAPKRDLEYRLRTFEQGSPIDKLMVALCAGDDFPESEAQLAIWITRNGISKQQFAMHPNVATFQTGAPVRLHHAEGAARLIRTAGLTPETLRFYGQPRPQAEPRREVPPPAPRPQQAPPPEIRL